MSRRKGEIDRSFFDDMLGKVEEASAPAQIAEVPLDQIIPRVNQFRRIFNQKSIEALAASISELGLLEPIVVREQEGNFEIVAGERRYRALSQLGWKSAPVRVMTFNDAQAELAGAVENLNREDLSPLEEVDAVLSVIRHTLNLSQIEAAELITQVRTLELEEKNTPEGNMAALTSLFKRLGYTSVNSFYANRLSLLRYPDDLLQAMRERGLAYTKARVLTRIKDPEIRQGLTETTLHDNLSVEEVEQAVRAQAKNPHPSPELYSDFGQLKRRITKRWVQELDPTKQKRLRRLMNDIEKLLEESS